MQFASTGMSRLISTSTTPTKDGSDVDEDEKLGKVDMLKASIVEAQTLLALQDSQPRQQEDGVDEEKNHKDIT